jgi:hypothetical protein
MTIFFFWCTNYPIVFLNRNTLQGRRLQEIMTTEENVWGSCEAFFWIKKLIRQVPVRASKKVLLYRILSRAPNACTHTRLAVLKVLCRHHVSVTILLLDFKSEIIKYLEVE